MAKRPTQDDLSAYWRQRLPDDALGVPWEMAMASCWRCGMIRGLQRCHIVPKSREGADEPANLVRLCTPCHREQPNVTDPAVVWRWIAATRHNGWWRFNEAWLAAYEQLFGESPGSHADKAPANVKDLLAAALLASVPHWGDGLPNPATIACAVREAEGLPLS